LDENINKSTPPTTITYNYMNEKVIEPPVKTTYVNYTSPLRTYQYIPCESY